MLAIHVAEEGQVPYCFFGLAHVWKGVPHPKEFVTGFATLLFYRFGKDPRYRCATLERWLLSLQRCQLQFPAGLGKLLLIHREVLVNTYVKGLEPPLPHLVPECRETCTSDARLLVEKETNLPDPRQ
jgi:hypothetical protein